MPGSTWQRVKMPQDREFDVGGGFFFFFGVGLQNIPSQEGGLGPSSPGDENVQRMT